MYTLDEMTPEVASRHFPHLPAEGRLIARQAAGHLPPDTGLPLAARIAERSAFGARKFGFSWRTRDNCRELCEETTNTIIYAVQEIARLDLALTSIEPGSPEATEARGYLTMAARHAALADHCGQLARNTIRAGGRGRA